MTSEVDASKMFFLRVHDAEPNTGAAKGIAMGLAKPGALPQATVQEADGHQRRHGAIETLGH
jgi:hypothetical protein